MNYTFTGKNIAFTDAMKDKITQKIGKLQKLFPDPQHVDVFVTVGVVKNNHTVEVTIPVRKRILRAEVTADSAYTAIDQVVDILEKQMVKYKGQLQNRSNRDSRFNEELTYFSTTETSDGNGGIQIEKTKRFALKPMDAEEAVMEMELLNHSFFVFRNGDTDEVNVVYRRKNGSYGLIEPEF